MGSFEPTPQQRRAMEDRGGSLLVSAAAGSGKTKVLVERLFGYMERERCRIDDFLIITFTKAAAAELRGRIAAELSQRVARQPENMHLRRQMMRVYQADIKTVDAFCGSLLRENIHLLPPEGQRSLTPDFRVLDQQEAELLRMQVLEQVLEEFYQRIGRGDTQAQQLAETLGAGRDDRALERLVLDIHGKIQSHAYPMRWLGRLREQWQQVPESVGPYREVLTDSILRRTRFWARKLTETAAWMEQYPDLYRGYGDRFLEMAEQLQGYEAAAQEGWDAMARLKPAFRRMGVVKGCDGAKEQAQAVRKRCKDELDEIGALLAVSESEQREDLEAMAPAMLALVRLTEDFTAAYQAERDLDRLMYQDTGLYRNQQYAKASTVLLQTMYEEIPILWDQEMKYRPSFSAAGDTVTLPVICQKICGVKDGNASQYWLDIKKLITPDTEVIRSVPWVQGTDPNPVKPYATQFLKNGKLLRGKIKSHSAYLYGILRAEMQEHLLDKLQLLLDQKLIRGTFENGTEYTVIATALNLPKDLLRKIQKFDFTKKNPKLIYINPTEERISLEDSILAAFLSLVGFDVLFFVPTGYQCIEQHFTRPFASETQIGDYLYDLRIPDFNTVQESGLHSIRKLFGRSI